MTHNCSTLARELMNSSADVWAISGRTVSRAELHERVSELEARFAGHGIGPGSTVALRMVPSCTLLQVLFALWARGAQVMLIDVRLKPPEYEQLLASREPFFHVHSGPRAGRAAGFAEDAPVVVETRPSGVPAAPGTEVCLVQFSSGSTGRPKVIGRTAASLRAELDRYAAIEGMPRSGERLVLLNSVIHTMGLIGGVMHAMNVGATLVLPSRPQARDVLAIAADTGARAIFGVPVHFDLLSRVGDPPPLPDLRLAVSAGEILPASTHERFAARFGLPISPVYGMTEVGVIATDLAGEHPPLVVGRPAPGIDVRVAGGELHVRLPCSPYLEVDRAGRYVDGWLRTFDRFDLDEATGLLTIRGRADSVVAIGGLKIDLAEIDAQLAKHPQVDEVVVVYGDVVEAFVGTSASLATDELTAWCRERLADVKIPKRFFIGRQVPRNPNGKLLRNRELLHTAYRAAHPTA